MATTAREFEQAIHADPDDPAPYLVYADWLQGQGDPRGELIVLQHRESTNPSEDVTAAIAAHFAKHPDLLGPFSTFAPPPDPKQRYPRGKQLKLAWRRGFIENIDVAWGMYEQGGTSESAAEELRAMLEHPSARFVTRFAIGPTPGEDGMYMRGVDEVVAKTDLAALRDLEWGRTGEWDISSTGTGALGPILSRFAAQLVRVRVRGGEIQLADDLVLPELRTFIVETGGLSTTALGQITAARWPKLEHLEIWFGQTNYGSGCNAESVAALLARTDLPVLRHLGLRNCPFIDAVIPMLAKAPLLAQLTSLDLSMGALSDAGIEALVTHQDAFRHLAAIDIDDNAVSEASEAACAAYTPGLEMGEQDAERALDPDMDINDRWTAVGE